MKKLTVTQYSNYLGVSRTAILKRINNKKLPKNATAEKIGSVWIITIK